MIWFLWSVLALYFVGVIAMGAFAAGVLKNVNPILCVLFALLGPLLWLIGVILMAEELAAEMVKRWRGQRSKRASHPSGTSPPMQLLLLWLPTLGG
jgi:hypothetical protein